MHSLERQWIEPSVCEECHNTVKALGMHMAYLVEAVSEPPAVQLTFMT